MVFTDPKDTVFAYENRPHRLVPLRQDQRRRRPYPRLWFLAAEKKNFGVDLTATRPLPKRKIDEAAVVEFKKDKEYVDVNCLGVLMSKKQIGKLVDACFHLVGNTKTAELLDKIKAIGYHYARQAGMSIAISDIQIPAEKWDILNEADKKVQNAYAMYQRGLITENERYNKSVEIWTKATTTLRMVMMDNMDPFNSIFMMADSGARGSRDQIRQVAGMRGLMADPSGPYHRLADQSELP